MTTVERAHELYKEGLRDFCAEDNERCIALINESLQIGRDLEDDKIVGQALMRL